MHTLAFLLLTIATADFAPKPEQWSSEPYGEPTTTAVTPAGSRQWCLVRWQWPDGEWAEEAYRNFGREPIRPGQPVRVQKTPGGWAVFRREVVVYGLEEA